MGNCLRPYVTLAGTEDRQRRKSKDRSNAYLPTEPVHIESTTLQHNIPESSKPVDLDNSNEMLSQNSVKSSPSVDAYSNEVLSKESLLSGNEFTPTFLPTDLMHISDREDLTTFTDTLFLKRFYSLVNPSTLAKPSFSKKNSIVSANRKFSSTSSVFMNDSTVSQPNMKHTLKCVSLALHHLIVFDAQHNDKLDVPIFDERIHPVSNHNSFSTKEISIPDTKYIYKFMKNLFQSAQLTAECAIITLIYLERLLSYAEINITAPTWKRILLGSILLASKVWDDQAVWNVDYCHILKELQVDDVNEMERYLLELLQFDINVPSSVYAKYYFDLRTLADFNNISLPLEPMDKKKALHLEAVSVVNDNEFETELFSTNRSNSVEQVCPSKSHIILN